MDVTSTQGIDFLNFQCWEIINAPATSPESLKSVMMPL